MSIREKNDIRVYNEMPAQVNLVGQYRKYVFPAAVGGVPSMNLVDFADIEYAHHRSSVFSNGLLVFDENEREEIYNELRFYDWKDKVWFESDIKDVVENPTIESMQRIIDTTSLATIERIRSKVVYAVNHNKNISNKVVTSVNTRYNEISSGIRKSKIVVKPTDVATKSAADLRVEALEKQLKEMTELMAKMAANMNAATAQEDEPVQPKEEAPAVEQAKPVAKKKSTRKKASEPTEVVE